MPTSRIALGRVANRTARPLAALAGALLLGACVTPSQSLRVNLVDLQPVEMKLLEQRFDVELRVQNPNDSSYSIRGVDLVLEVNDLALGSAVSNQQVELPAYGEALFTMSMTSGLFQLVRQVAKLSERGEGSLSYRLRGHLKVDGPFGRLPFDNRGELDFGAVDGQLVSQQRP